MIAQLSKLLEPLKRKLSLIVGRGVIQLTTDETANQRAQASLLAGEVRDGLERFQEYGFTSRPLPGAEAVVLFPGGNREFGLIVAVEDRRYRLKSLAEGEVCLYTDEGDKIHLKRGGLIEIKAASKVVVQSPAVEIGSGSLEKVLNGEAFQTFFNNHRHIGNLGVPTSTPVEASPASHLSGVVKAAK